MGDESEREIIDGYVVSEMLDELAEEGDPQVAMRKALLAMLVLTTESESPAMRAFQDFLLLAFAPIADALKDGSNRHPLFGDVEVMRARLQDGRLALLLPMERLAKKMNLDM